MVMFFPYILENYYPNITLKIDTSWNSDTYTLKYGLF